MRAVCLHDKETIEIFLRSNVFLHLYSLGDLDDFFWPYTSWYALTESEDIQAIALMYTGGSMPCVHALGEDNKAVYVEELLRSLIPVLPRRFHAHLVSGTERILAEVYHIKPFGVHDRMALKNRSMLTGIDTSGAEELSISDLNEITSLYAIAYPGNFFEPKMLETEQYYGIRQSGKLVSVAGVHVYSRRYRVAALGNIATHPDYRGRGYGRTAAARVCQSLLNETDHIGLNVKADNTSAIRCYEQLGFEAIGSYGEFEAEFKTS